MTLLESPPAVSPGPNLLLHGVSWDTYVKLRDETDAVGQQLFITYDNGELEIMPPLPIHDRVKMVVHDLVMLMCAVRKIDVVAMGSTTHKREAIAKGIEADSCYFIAQAAAARDAKFDAVRGQVPDLAVEIDITRRSVPREPIYSALGVAELWRYRAGKIAFLALRDGRYQLIDQSIAFPFLTAAELDVFIDNVDSMPYPQWQDEFRQWVRSIQ